MADILISAAKADQGLAEFLGYMFSERGFTVDWVTLDPNDAGAKSAILSRRAAARATLALWSKNSVRDPAIVEEAREGLRRGSLLMARVDESLPPPEFATSASMANLAGWDGSSDNIEAGRLITELSKILERTSTRPVLAQMAARLGRSSGGQGLAFAAAPDMRPGVLPDRTPAPQQTAASLAQLTAAPVQTAASESATAPLVPQPVIPAGVKPHLAPVTPLAALAASGPAAPKAAPSEPPLKALQAAADAALKAPAQTISAHAEPAMLLEAASAAAKPAPAAAPVQTKASKPENPRRRFLRDRRPDPDHDGAARPFILGLGFIACAAALALLWHQTRPQDFALRASAPAPQIAARAAQAGPAAEIAPAPRPEGPIILHPELTAAAAEAISAAPIEDNGVQRGLAPAAAAPQSPAAQTQEPSAATTSNSVTTQTANAKAAQSSIVESEPTSASSRAAAPSLIAPPAPSPRKLASVGQLLDQAAAAPAKKITALARAPLTKRPPPRPAVIPFDETPSLTVFKLEADSAAFHLPGLAPTMLGSWRPDTPPPALAHGVITPADWSAAPAGILAQSALGAGSYKDYLAQARTGSPDSMLTLGLMRQTGAGAIQNDAIAFAWLRRSAIQGNARALAELGAYYASGRAALRDDKRAARLFRRSEKAGAAAGKTALAWSMVSGRGLDADPAQARALLEAAAKDGEVMAALNLGRLYADGVGGKPEPLKAVHYYALAANQGYAPAQYALAVMLLQNAADPLVLTAAQTDNALAPEADLPVRRLQQAAAQGYPEAQRLLGGLYAQGKTLAQDSALAKAWYQRASAQTQDQASRKAAMAALAKL